MYYKRKRKLIYERTLKSWWKVELKDTYVTVKKWNPCNFFSWHIFHKFSEASSQYKIVISLPLCQLQNLKLFPPMCSQNHCPSLTGEQHLLCMIKRSPWRGQMLLGGRSLLQWPQDWKENQHQLWLRASTRDRKWRGPFYHHSQEQSHIGTTEQPMGYDRLLHRGSEVLSLPRSRISHPFLQIGTNQWA